MVDCAGFLGLAGVPDGNACHRDDRGWQRQNFLDAVDSLFPRMHPQPAGTHAENVSGQPEILDCRRAILKQVTQLLAVRRLQVTSDRDAQRGICEHPPGRQHGCDAGPGWLLTHHHEAPRVFGGGGRCRHRRRKQRLNLFLAHLSGRIRPNAPPLEKEAKFLVHTRIPKGFRCDKISAHLPTQNKLF